MEGREEGREERGTNTGEEGRGKVGQDSRSTETENKPEDGRGKRTRKTGSEKQVGEVLGENLVIVETPKMEEETVIEEKKETVPKPRKKKPQPSDLIQSDEISFLIQGMFSLVALKMGEHWNVSQEESKTVAVPLTNILKKAELLEKVATVSDGMMLLLACATITIPRVMLTQSMKPKKVRENNGQTKQESTSISEVGQSNFGGNETSISYDEQSIKTLVNATSPIY